MDRKKKTTSGKHSTPRKPIQVPVNWLRVGHALAKLDEKPLLWYVLKRWAEEAKEKGIECPPLPWEGDDELE